MSFFISRKIPFGEVLENGVDFLIDNGASFFDTISIILSFLVGSIFFLLKILDPVYMAIFVTIIAFAIKRSFFFSIFVFLALLFIDNQGYWLETMQTLSMVISSTLICMGIGVPIGIFVARNRRFMIVLEPILDLMQTVPTFVYLIPALVLFGLGIVPGVIATVIFAIPASIRMTYLGISSTPIHLIEAVNSFGASSFKILLKVELPYALPNIRAGLTQTIMLSLSMVVIAALVGAEGLGTVTIRALNQVNVAKGFEVGFIIVLVAVILDRLCRINAYYK